MGKWLVKARYLPLVSKSLYNLQSRRLPDNLRQKTFTFAGPMIRYGLRRALNRLRPGADMERIQRRWSIQLSNAMAKRGFGGATHLYSMLGETRGLMVAAKTRGIVIVLECYILPNADKIVAAEQARFPDWERMENQPVAPDENDEHEKYWKLENFWSLPDFIIAPSEAVRDDVMKISGIPAERIAVVPYGVNASWLDLDSRPVPRRVLFVGTADLRKGIHYLAAAAEKLAAKNIHCEFRVAGNVPPQIARRPDCRLLNFLGRVPRERIAEEYLLADVFVLPSLAEGSAEATYEALASGLPVITTRAAGSVVRDGIEGRIVPERDASALADAIEELVGNRALRDQMALAARERARDYTWEKYGGRLISALNSFGSKSAHLKCPEHIATPTKRLI